MKAHTLPPEDIGTLLFFIFLPVELVCSWAHHQTIAVGFPIGAHALTGVHTGGSLFLCNELEVSLKGNWLKPLRIQVSRAQNTVRMR